MARRELKVRLSASGGQPDGSSTKTAAGMNLIGFYCIVLVMVIATALPLSTCRYWWVRGLDFPRLLIATTLTLLWLLWLILYVDGHEPMLLAIIALSVALGYQLWWILPYTEVHDQEVLGATAREREECPSIKLVTSNVLMTNRKPARLLGLIEDFQPHVVAALETDQWWQDQLDAALHDYPHRIACPLDNKYGMHVYSRLPLENASTQFMVEADIPSMHATLRLDDDERIDFHVVHPTPPAPGENERSTERDVEMLILAGHLEGHDRPTIVAGDLNDVAWSATTRLFRRISGLLDPRVGRGMYNTFSADYPFLRWPLDHVFVSDHFRIARLERLPYIGSDHFPIAMHLILTNRNDQRAQLDPDEVDHELAEEIMDTDVARQANGLDIDRDEGAERDP